MASDAFDIVRNLIALKWSPDILNALADAGPLRYTDLQRCITMASGQTVHSRALTSTLHTLQKYGLVDHLILDQDGAAYRLTSEGHEFTRLIGTLEDFGEQHSGTFDL